MEEVGMKVSRLYRVSGSEKLKGFADLAINGNFIVKGLRIVQGKNGLFVGMPRQQGKDGKWYNIAYPVTKELQQQINELVLEAYEE